MRSFRFLCAGAALAVSAMPTCAVHAAKITKLKVDAQTTAILIDGQILAGDDKKFIKLSLSAPNSIVVLSSPGGALLPALEIGKAIHLQNLPTMVYEDGVCASSCALIWVAGAMRMKAPNARIGFHASYVDEQGQVTPTAVGNALVGRYLTQLELSQDAVIFATETPPDEISWLTDDIAERTGITFETLDGDDGETTEAQNKANHHAIPSPATTSPPATDQDRRDLINVIRANARTENILAVFRKSGLSKEYYHVFEDHFRSIFADGKFLEYFAKRFFERAGNNFKSLTEDQAALIGRSISTDAKMNGLSRLSDQEIASYFELLAFIAEHSTPLECRTVFGKEAAKDFVEMRLVARGGPGYLEKYLTLTRDAVLAVARDFPPPPQFSKEEQERVERTRRGAFDAALLRLNPSDREKVSKALNDMRHASDQDYCSAMRFILTTARDLQGQQGATLRRASLAALAK